MVLRSSAASTPCCARSSRCCRRRSRQRAIDTRRRLRHRAAERRGRARRDLPGDGEQRDDVRRARLSAGSSAARHRARARSRSCWSCKADEAYCQPCVSPVWDTGARLPRAARGRRRDAGRARGAAGLDWLEPLQVLDVQRRLGRAARRTCGPAAGRSSTPTRTIPIVDDTAVVVMAMDRAQAATASADYRRGDRARARMDRRHAEPERRLGRVRCRQRRITTSTTFRSPTTARCSIRRPTTSPRAASRCWRSSARRPKQPGGGARRSTICGARSMPDGSWYGRWGMNYIYGTWSVLCALNAAGVDHDDAGDAQGGRLARRDPERRTAAGARTARATSSTIAGYEPRAEHGLADRLGAARPDGGGRGRPSGGRARHRLSRGARKARDGFWDEARYTATGFPRVFYLRYHGYPKFFPLWALARYRNLRRGNTPAVAYGM